MDTVDAVVVGAGFAGLYSLYKLREQGLRVQGFEAGDSVGGTWYWNHYPGARCDVESLDYSYSFSDELQQEWVWSERYPAQPEILRYLRHVADRFDLWPLIELETRVTAAVFDEAAGRWTVTTDRGHQLSARYVVMATGCLSDARVPDFPGRDSFAGESFHTARWPDDGAELSGKRVGVIGTGSSGVQVIPEIAAQAERLFVLQRTPAYSIPAHNRPLGAEQDEVKADYPGYRERARWTLGGVPQPFDSEVRQGSVFAVDPETRRREFQRCWDHGGNAITNAFNDLMATREANETVAEFIRGKISELVEDPALAKKLTPTHYPYAAKRPCIDTDYFVTFNRENVELVDLREEPLEEITPRGIRVGDREIELDVIVYATGFDAFTGSLSQIRIEGRDHLTVDEKWAAGPRAYLGTLLAGFPNLFLITGPGSPSVLSNMVLSIEQHVEWISDLIEYMAAHGHEVAEVEQEAEDSWMEYTTTMAKRSVYYDAASWYLGANIPGKPVVFMPFPGGVDRFRRRCNEIADTGYPTVCFSGTAR